MSLDHYATLGLDRQCTLAQIRAAYRTLAKRHHPDVNGGSAEAAERATTLNAAHETLSDPARRRAYDRSLADREKSPPPATRPSRAERNISQDTNLRIEDFLRGTTLQVRVHDPANPGGHESYELVIPPGTAPGARFRLPREEPFAGGFVQVRVKALPGFRFKARGSDLRCDLRIDHRRAEHRRHRSPDRPHRRHAPPEHPGKSSARDHSPHSRRRSAQAARRARRSLSARHLPA